MRPATQRRDAPQEGATRGEFAPPTLRQLPREADHRHQTATRGEFAPPTLRQRRLTLWRAGCSATRGEFAPPTLRHLFDGFIDHPLPAYEGRIRPSYIAATPASPDMGWSCSPTRGEFAPPTLRRSGSVPSSRLRQLRGANSPLLHCGPGDNSTLTDRIRPSRGEFAPPTLRRNLGGLVKKFTTGYEGRIRPSYIAACQRRGTLRRCICYEGRIRPSYIAAPCSPFSGVSDRPLRGANSPLLHCGGRRQRPGIPGADRYEGRIRPSYIAA